MTSPSQERVGQRPDDVTRQQVRDRLSENLYLEAGAGTGKTNALVMRVIELLVTRTAEPDQIAAITFTRAAAFEMRSRVRAALEQRVDSEPDSEIQSHIAAVVDRLDSLAIQTIQSFALSMLREKPLDIGLPPVIEALDDIQGAIEFDSEWSDWFSERIESDVTLAPTLGIAQGLGMKNPVDILHKAANGFNKMHQRLKPGMFAYSGPQPLAITTDFLLKKLQRANSIVDAAPDADDLMCKFVNEKVAPEIRMMLSLAEGSDDIPAADFVEWPVIKSTRKGSKKTWAKAINGEAMLDELRELLADLQEEIDRSLTALKRHTLATLLTTAVDFALDYSQMRRLRGRLTFHDQLVMTNELLRSSADARQRFRNRFKFILVDEFQDTDPLQIELLRHLTEAAGGDLRSGSLFIVGDPKQSIYRFRGADPASSGSFSAQVATSGRRLPLSENHRSLPGILKWVNTVFAGWMKEGEAAGQAPHRDLNWEPELETGETETGGPPVHWFGGERETDASETRQNEFEDISAIAEAAGAGAFRVRDGVSGWRDSTFGDVAVLMRGRTGIDMLEQALTDKRVPYILHGQAPLFTSQDIRDLYSCLTAIDDPANQVATLAALRSPAFSCPDTDLLLWKIASGGFEYVPDAQPNRPTSIAMAFTELRRFHTLSRELSAAELIELFIRERRLREKAMLTRSGPERARRLDLVVELANVISDPEPGNAGNSITLRHFTRWLARQSDENARMPDHVSQGETGNAVRLMTIHGAKGLEFPIVVMASANGSRTSKDSVQLRTLTTADGKESLEVQFGDAKLGLKTGGADDAMAQEAIESELEDVRLLYVAATRAKDHLLISRYRSKSGKKPLVRDIEHHLNGNEHLWQQWSYPGRSQRKVPDSVAPTDSKARRDDWVSDRAALLAAASMPHYTTPTALKPGRAELAAMPKEASPILDDEAARRGRAATELGRAVHGVLQYINLTGWNESELSALSMHMAEEHREADASQIASLARAALGTETMAHAIAAAKRGKAWREVSVAAPLPGNAGELEGQIDLLYLEEDGSLTVVDHKTDRDRGDSLEEAAGPYLAQMGAYAWCVEQVTGMTVKRAVLLFANRARAGGDCEYVVPDLIQEKQRAAQSAVERVSAPADAS